MSNPVETNGGNAAVAGSPRRKPPSQAVGEVLTWLCGGTLGLCLLMVIGLLWVLAYNGLGHFWQKDVVLLTLQDGRRMMGEIHGREPVFAPEASGDEKILYRIRLKTGNRDLSGADFEWVDEAEIAGREYPGDATVLERLEWGNFYGNIMELRRGDEVLASGQTESWKLLESLRAKKHVLLRRIVELEKGPIGEVNHEIEQLNRKKKGILLRVEDEERLRDRLRPIDAEIEAREKAYRQLAEQLGIMRRELLRETLVMEAADGSRREVPVGHIVRALRPNRMGTMSTTGLYLGRIWEFLTDEPRESNTEGGIFPAIFGTVLMVFLMVFFVTPLGVLAAVYMREYARQGWVIRSIRIAVNNLAGVPSIVFGVFGLGFFVYLVGGTLDQLFHPESLPTPTYGTGGILWASLTLALLTVPVVIVATEEGLAAVPRIVREGSLALGATKFETTWKVVVPAAAPGILTGVILAMARAAGEVAPLMVVGMVKLAPALPIDGHFPYVHLERKFMHLGFHIYDLGFQSPNVEATKPLVFATALLLVAIVVAMNLVAIAIRNRLRKKYASSAV